MTSFDNHTNHALTTIGDDQCRRGLNGNFITHKTINYKNKYRHLILETTSRYLIVLVSTLKHLGCW